MNGSIQVWTDGACKGNPGPGGWGAIVVRAGQPDLELSGFAPATTNNRMELTAAIEGLRVLVSAGDGVVVHTDSQLVVKGMTEWIGGWERRAWRKADGEPVLNAELWQALLEQVRRLGRVSWQWVKGHAGVPLNERADQLAVAAIERRSGVSEPTRARTENELLLDLERRVRKAVGAHRGQVPVYDEILDQLDAMRAKPVSTRSS